MMILLEITSMGPLDAGAYHMMCFLLVRECEEIPSSGGCQRTSGL